MLASIVGEYGIVTDPEIKFSDKGNAWMKLRVVSKDRVRDSNGAWSDGKACFMDMFVAGKQAEHLFDSVSKGDTVIATGKLEQTEWVDSEGAKRTSYRIMVENIGVSVRWGPAKTVNASRTTSGNGNVARMTEEFEAQVIPNTPPF